VRKKIQQCEPQAGNIRRLGTLNDGYPPASNQSHVFRFAYGRGMEYFESDQQISR